MIGRDVYVNDFKLRLVHPTGKLLDFLGPADIAEEQTDTIVNAANSSLLGGGGVDGAIHDAGGPAILEECRQIVARSGPLPPGRAVITSGGKLKAKHVIHTVGPIYRARASDPETLASCYSESIRLADRRSLRSIAFPSISTGAFGYPVPEAAQVAITTVIQELERTTTLQHARFVLFDLATLRIYTQSAEKFVKTSAHSYQIERAS